MKQPQAYVLGDSARAARRLEIQDAHFAEASEHLLDDLALRPNDRVVELGCGPGMFSRRVLRRLGAGGVLVGVDSSEALLNEACRALAPRVRPRHGKRSVIRGRTRGASALQARFEPVLADITQLGSWLDGVDVIVGRAVLHHIPMVEFLLGRLRAVLRPGTRVGFLEPDFRTPLGRLAYLENTSRPELSPLATWATAINHLYQLRRLSPDVGPLLARTLETAGYSHVRGHLSECPSDETVIENIVMFYDEVRDTLQELGILTTKETERQQQLLRGLPAASLPAVWGLHRVACEV